ncbi:DUF3710 domain-containing protein [Kribbella solani]|uniref:DUF3710 domain-containing protein n=1 Tax=Kribbella solani TaxID=236067 RepID=A0A841DP52_9ACTN|nr:DUF3710 domain-containing protein [Kribbella solani]MBB5978735.1 hypothetical protein [Kribbella solani]MDX2968837.1 DUF3710 domain-containing protein [Kribbella solani]MDX3000546.1 DUF3710 domain-containing protein [Kribbella solani]
MIFRRKGRNEDADLETEGGPDEAVEPRAEGPFDVTEVDAEVLEADDRIDLGALVVTGMPGMELGLQVDEQSGVVQAVLLMLEDSALELRAFAAPKKSGIWDEVRQEIAAEASRMGGTATETDGPFGTELVLVVPVEDPEGQIFSQTSRVIGVDGPRWLLRGTVLGRAAVEPDAAEPMEATLRNTVVVRGDEPMAVRESLPLRLPPGAEPNPDEEQV